MTIKERERELYRDLCFIKTALITIEDNKLIKNKKERKAVLMRKKLELEERRLFYKNYIKEMEKIK